MSRVGLRPRADKFQQWRAFEHKTVETPIDEPAAMMTDKAIERLPTPFAHLIHHQRALDSLLNEKVVPFWQALQMITQRDNIVHHIEREYAAPKQNSPGFA